MLNRIILENFKSFKERTVIDLSRTNYTSLSNNVSDNGILKGAMFVGPNASGKSNIIYSIKLLIELLFNEKNIFSGDIRCIYTGEPKYSMEYHFNIEGSKIEYYIQVNDEKKVITEKLYLDGAIMLERFGNVATSYIAEMNGITYDEMDVDRGTLFVRTLFFNTKFTSKPKLRSWIEYLMNSVYLNMFEKSIMSYDTEDIRLSSYIEKYGDEEINKFLDTYNFKQRIEYKHRIEGNGYSIAVGEDENDKYIFFRKIGLEAPIPFSWESLGNRNLLIILPVFFYVLKKGGMLIVDEFSSGFHNELEALLIRYFMDKSVTSQIFFVSHSTNLLTNALLRPDQEYSVELVDVSGSKVKRFSEEQPRLAQNIEKMYLSGVFGGLPNYRKDKDEDK